MYSLIFRQTLHAKSSDPDQTADQFVVNGDVFLLFGAIAFGAV